MEATTIADLSISFRISWISRLQRQRFDERARSLGLTRAQWRVIAAISVSPGETQSRIAAQLEVSNVTAGRIIERLEKNGWIERKADPSDRRANRLYPTPAATPMLDQLSVIAAEEEAIALEGIGEDERARLGKALDRLIANMVQGAPELTAADPLDTLE